MSDRDPSGTDPLEGRVIQGRWRLERKLGEGGMGAVYLAEQLSIRGRRVAVKLLHGELARDPEYVARFRSEAERAATLADPRIVTVFDFGEVEDGGLFIAMEYVRGETLAALIRGGALPLERAVWFGIQLAEALQRVHDAGVIHRDVKPANVMVLTGGDDLKLMDFGIARGATDSERTHHTKTGLVVGTPAYMAPEQITDGICSVQTDVYAWGLVMYALLTGRKPFEGNSASIQYKHVHEPPPPIRSSRPETPPAVEAVVLSALAKQPHERPQRMAEIAAALRGAPRLAPPPPEEPTAVVDAPLPPPAPRRHTVWVLAALGVLGIAVGAVSFSAELRDRLLLRERLPHATGASVAVQPAERGTGDAGTVVSDALGLADFFIDRGEYDSAIRELEDALGTVPNEPRLRAALERARKAQAAEAAVVEGKGN